MRVLVCVSFFSYFCSMKIGLIRETKVPVDNRVALVPNQVAELNNRFPDHEVVVQTSDIRCYADEEYCSAGVRVVDSVEDCDVLFGIKEAALDSLISGRHYFYFGHIAKMQQYNLPEAQGMVRKGITFTDYEYLTDENHMRVCAFGWWAGVVGVYYMLRGFGLRTHAYALPAPTKRFTLEELKNSLKAIRLPFQKLLVTGAGRVSQGAQYVLDQIGAKRVSSELFLSDSCAEDGLVYCVADVDQLVKRADGDPFSMADFVEHPQQYVSDFARWAQSADLLLCAHFWSPEAPVYLDESLLASDDLRIRMVADVTCDIMGSVKSTLRSSTHDDPYYDYDRHRGCECPAFSDADHVTVMAVDTCPNALAMDTSAYFGQMLMEHVMVPMLEGKVSPVIERGTIMKQGRLTPEFEYLADWIGQK